MKANIIMMLDTDRKEIIEKFEKGFEDNEVIIMPDCAKILLKKENGLWEKLE